MTDVMLFHTADGGEVEIVNGLVTMDDGLEAAAYLSLAGGNSEDSGDEAEDPKQWWGNVGELVPARRYRSEFQYLLQDSPAITSNLVLLEEAAVRDLARTFDDIATQISAAATMPAVNRVDVAITITIDASLHTFTFSYAWGQQ